MFQEQRKRTNVSDDDVTMKMQMSMRDAPEDMSLLCFGYLRELEDVLEKHALKEKKATKMENGDNGGINGIGEKNAFANASKPRKISTRALVKFGTVYRQTLYFSSPLQSATLRRYGINRKKNGRATVNSPKPRNSAEKKEGLQNWTDEEQQVLNKRWDQTQLGVAFCAIKPVPEEGEKHAVVAAAAQTKSSKDEDE